MVAHTATWLASDHPVCAISDRDHFLNGAATPPSQGGEYTRSQIRHRNCEHPSILPLLLRPLRDVFDLVALSVGSGHRFRS